MRILPPDLRETVNKIGAGKPYAWLFAIVADEDYEEEAGTALYVTTYDQPLTFDNLLPLPATTRSYKPFGVQLSTIKVDTSGSTPALQVSVSNVFRDVSFRLETGIGFMGRRCVFAAVNVDHLDDGAILEGAGYVRLATVNGQVATYSVELYGLASIELPQAIYIVDRCRWLSQGGYGGEGCGFPLDLVTGAHDPEFKSCGGTLADCKARGLFELTTLNRPRRHPMLFGGFLGLPRLLRR